MTLPPPDDSTILMKLQNAGNPEQIIYLVMERENGRLRTDGLKHFFGVKEIRVDSRDLVGSIQEYAEVLSFLLETMSAAKDLHLPYGYQNEFEFGGIRYSLHEEGDFRVLKRL